MGGGRLTLKQQQDQAVTVVVAAAAAATSAARHASLATRGRLQTEAWLPFLTNGLIYASPVTLSSGGMCSLSFQDAFLLAGTF